jgi:hypothetical protein
MIASNNQNKNTMEKKVKTKTDYSVIRLMILFVLGSLVWVVAGAYVLQYDTAMVIKIGAICILSIGAVSLIVNTLLVLISLLWPDHISGHSP